MILYIVYDFKNLFIQLGLLLTLHFLLCLNFTIVFKNKTKVRLYIVRTQLISLHE